MPSVMMCEYCYKELNMQTEKYVIIQQAHNQYPLQIVHPACYEKQHK